MKKLYRNVYDSMVAGVCSGIADYFEIDKNVVRLIAAFLLLAMAPVTLITYIVAWVILPIKNY